MRVLVVTIPSSYGSRGNVVSLSPSLGVYRLMHFLLKSGINCDLFDPDLDDLNSVQDDYDVIAVSGTHIGIEQCLAVASSVFSIQKSPPLLVAGGIIPGHNPENWLKMGFDVVVLGFGEYPLKDICMSYARFGDKQGFKSIPGIAFYEDGNLVYNYNSVVDKSLFDELFYDNILELSIPYERYWRYNERFLDNFKTQSYYFSLFTTSLYTSSSCPNNCGYCFGRNLYPRNPDEGLRLFALSGEQLCNLIISDYSQHKMDHIYIKDDDFLFLKSRSKDFCQRLLSLKRDKKIPDELGFSCQGRVVNFLDKREVDTEIIDLLAQAGLRSVSLGVESCQEKILKSPIMNKNHYTASQVEDVVRALRDAGIVVATNFMLLTPDGTREDTLSDLYAMINLYRLGVDLRVAVGIFAYPGVPIVGDSRYRCSYFQLVSPISGAQLTLPAFYLPNDDDLIPVFDKFDEMYSIEEEKFRSEFNLYGNMRHSYHALIRCAALSRLLDDQKLAQKFYDIAHEMVNPQYK